MKRPNAVLEDEMKRVALPFFAMAWLTGILAAQAAPPAQAGAQGQARAGGARPPRYVAPSPYDFNDHAGWEPMFDGTTLKGWEGPSGIWRVEEGAIVTSQTADHQIGPVYLLWSGGDLKDFEFKTEIKLEGPGSNSGVQFRAKMLGKTDKERSEWESFGYQADYDYVNEQTGALIECCAGPRRGPSPRPVRATMGTMVRETASSDTPVLIGTIGDADALKKGIHTGDWNQLHVIVRGNTMMYILNGKLMSVFIDDNPGRAIAQGKLLLQLEGKGDEKVSYRNIWVKKLP
jgi:hypothetical protein